VQGAKDRLPIFGALINQHLCHRLTKKKKYVRQKSYQHPALVKQSCLIFSMGLNSMDLSSYASCVLSFADCTYAEPLPMIVLQREARALIDRHPEVKFACIPGHTKFSGYAAHIGYFKFLDFQRGNEIGEAKGSGNYVPIQFFDLNEMKVASGDRPYAEIIEEKASELALILTQQRSGEVFIALQYSIREMMRNSIEHSLGDRVVFLGQYWPTKHEAEIVLCDDGCGVSETLRTTEEVQSDKKGLPLALRPSISGVTEFEKSHQDEPYRNSGFGLYVTSRLCSEQGVFRIISGNAGLTRRGDVLTPHDWRFNGTCIQMKIRTDGLADVEGRIKSIVDEGERELAAAGHEREASSASKSISPLVC
jgi:hypothetical protein